MCTLPVMYCLKTLMLICIAILVYETNNQVNLGSKHPLFINSSSDSFQDGSLSSSVSHDHISREAYLPESRLVSYWFNVNSVLNKIFVKFVCDIAILIIHSVYVFILTIHIAPGSCFVRFLKLNSFYGLVSVKCSQCTWK